MKGTRAKLNRRARAIEKFWTETGYRNILVGWQQ